MGVSENVICGAVLASLLGAKDHRMFYYLLSQSLAVQLIIQDSAELQCCIPRCNLGSFCCEFFGLATCTILNPEVGCDSK